MKRVAIVFIVLLVAFCGVWIGKSKNPLNRPDDAKTTEDDPWYEQRGEIPTVNAEWVLDASVPENFVPVPGSINIFMEIDEKGNIVAYYERVTSENEDGTMTHVWKKLEEDNDDDALKIPEGYEPVPNLENVYKVTDEDGKVSYFKYVRNEDGSFAFVPVDEKGNMIEPPLESGQIVPENYIRIKDNIYAVYDKNGVCIGYKEKKIDSEGKYYWVDAKKPAEANPTEPNKPTDPTQPHKPTQPDDPSKPTSPDVGNDPTGPTGNDPSTGTYTHTQVITDTKIAGGWKITYETKITHTYKSDGTLLSTTQEGPYEVSRVKITDDNDEVPDPAKIASTLRGEYARVSVGTVYMKELAQEVLNILNAERVAHGLPAMVLNEESEAYLLAAIKAADMAIYNHAESNSPLYGTALDLCERYDIETGNVYDFTARTTNKGAANIAARLSIALNGVFNEKNFTEIGLVIVSKGAYYYIDFILME